MTQPRDGIEHFSQRNWQSVRTILEGLILLSVWGMWTSQMAQRETSAKIEEKITSMKDSVSTLQSQLSSIPAISQSMARIEVKLDEHERRLQNIEARKQP